MPLAAATPRGCHHGPAKTPPAAASSATPNELVAAPRDAELGGGFRILGALSTLAVPGTRQGRGQQQRESDEPRILLGSEHGTDVVGG
jgi:hypothetical protein